MRYSNQPIINKELTNKHILNGMVKMKLTENSSIKFSGRYTGKEYVISGMNDFIWVDQRDARDMTGNNKLEII